MLPIYYKPKLTQTALDLVIFISSVSSKHAVCMNSNTAVVAVSESKALCHPSSVDSLSTSAATEDHVSMGGWAARKALRVVEHVEQGETAGGSE